MQDIAERDEQPDAEASAESHAGGTLAVLFATVDKSVSELRAGDLSGRKIRELARARGDRIDAVWAGLTAGPRKRGGR